MGFERVYDYVPGKADWSASGLPTEGTMASSPTVGAAARGDVPTCTPEEKAKDAWERARKGGWDRCVVTNEERVVLGLLRERDPSPDPAASVERVMSNGPATFRPNEPVGKVAERMRKRGASAVLVTTSDGKLVGLVYQEDAERLADEQEA